MAATPLPLPIPFPCGACAPISALGCVGAQPQPQPRDWLIGAGICGAQEAGVQRNQSRVWRRTQGGCNGWGSSQQGCCGQRRGAARGGVGAGGAARAGMSAGGCRAMHTWHSERRWHGLAGVCTAPQGAAHVPQLVWHTRRLVQPGGCSHCVGRTAKAAAAPAWLCGAGLAMCMWHQPALQCNPQRSGLRPGGAGRHAREGAGRCL
jgi:hypothetical protein